MKHRLETHIAALRWNNHRNEHLQRARNRDGESNFIWGAMIVCAIGDLLYYEQICIDRIVKDDTRYNISLVSGAGMRELKQSYEVLSG